jgi:hypothetical protein
MTVESGILHPRIVLSAMEIGMLHEDQFLLVLFNQTKQTAKIA